MFNIGMTELILVLVIVLVVFGPSKLPEVGKAIGKSIRGFKEETNGMKEEIHKATALEAPPAKDQGKTS
ncbi:twin-arginine translocase TatA/TatE family subunit [Anaeroselena agilis]|uniref:Sec-independent protein translocase protein TatA n=1 Tax=Anaeroselena agilis TaxID=3063788 RepID=A0ABU3NYN7_9FIRM|nr:twin-arginine translocase TatA/TatE family subunit [Selenomonadales bacterium 4137-cl]